MSDNGPCNCDQSLELTKMLEELTTYVEGCVTDIHHFELRDKARAARALLEKYEQETIDASRCQHCGLPGGH